MAAHEDVTTVEDMATLAEMERERAKHLSDEELARCLLNEIMHDVQIVSQDYNNCEEDTEMSVAVLRESAFRLAKIREYID